MSDLADRNWWRRVGKLIGSTLRGWSYRDSASFIKPQAELTGKVGTILLGQKAELNRLQEQERRMRRLVVALLSLHPNSEMILDSGVFNDGVDCYIGERRGKDVTMFFIIEKGWENETR